MTKYELRTFDNAEELARVAAELWMAELASSSQPYFAAFSGGRIARDFCRALASGASVNAESLRRVHFFWADERCVPPTDAESNYRLVFEEFIGPAGIAAEKIHRVRGEDSPAVAAREADDDIKRTVSLSSNGIPVMDMIFLGLGEDGHVASLFPPIASVAEKRAFLAVIGPKPPPNRITMSYEVICTAKKVWMLASGEGKVNALRESLRADGKTPLGEVIRRREMTNIFTDIKA